MNHPSFFESRREREEGGEEEKRERTEFSSPLPPPPHHYHHHFFILHLALQCRHHRSHFAVLLFQDWRKIHEIKKRVLTSALWRVSSFFLHLLLLHLALQCECFHDALSIDPLLAFLRFLSRLMKDFLPFSRIFFLTSIPSSLSSTASCAHADSSSYILHCSVNVSMMLLTLSWRSFAFSSKLEGRKRRREKRKRKTLLPCESLIILLLLLLIIIVIPFMRSFSVMSRNECLRISKNSHSFSSDIHKSEKHDQRSLLRIEQARKIQENDDKRENRQRNNKLIIIIILSSYILRCSVECFHDAVDSLLAFLRFLSRLMKDFLQFIPYLPPPRHHHYHRHSFRALIRNHDHERLRILNTPHSLPNIFKHSLSDSAAFLPLFPARLPNSSSSSSFSHLTSCVAVLSVSMMLLTLSWRSFAS